jgi:hypothetical protein
MILDILAECATGEPVNIEKPTKREDVSEI